ncbi:MAG: response regulator [Chthoniobacter sp.]
MKKENFAKRVLVVDDEENMVRLLYYILVREGYEVSCARNGREGLKLFGESAWDVVVTDGTMPEMNGDEMASLMRDAQPNIPIVLVSGMIREFKSALFDAALEKPFLSIDLLAMIEGIIAPPLKA